MFLIPPPLSAWGAQIVKLNVLGVYHKGLYLISYDLFDAEMYFFVDFCQPRIRTLK